MAEDLKDWTQRYIRNKDLISKRIERLDTEGDLIVCTYRDGKKGQYRILPFITAEDLTRLDVEETTIVCQNDRKNLKVLSDNWDAASSHGELCMIFVNLSSNRRWIIFPHTHNLICDPESLKRGLLALYNSIEEADA